MSLRVLVIDDAVDQAEMLAEFIASLGHHVRVATSATEARSFVQLAPFDVVFLDFVLPDGRGDQLALELRADGFSARVVATTGLVTRAKLEHDTGSGIDAFLLKPFSLARIREQLELAEAAGPDRR